MTGILAIGEREQEHIAIALDAARKRPVPWALLKTAAVDDRAAPTGTLMMNEVPAATRRIRQEYPSQRVQLGTYDCALSFEEQPAGLLKHLSVSSRLPGQIPSPIVMEMICLAFKFDEKLCRALGSEGATMLKPDRPARVWIEEFAPGHHAVNVTELAS